MDDLIEEFLAETNENLDALDLDLVNLEQTPNDAELLSRIFRLVHTIKGTCGFLGLPRLEKVAHHSENILGRFRDGELDVTPEYVTLIFESIDRIKLIVNGLAETEKEPEGDDSALIARLDAAYKGQTPPSNDAFIVETLPAEPDPPIQTPTPLTEEETKIVAATLEANEAQPDNTETEKAAPTQNLRVNLDTLENLMTMVSELVLTRNQLNQILRAQNDSDFTAPLQRLSHVVSELQEGVMQTRMQPIGNAWTKLPRLIRDLSIELDKKIELEMHGENTELDRQILELIKDPLTHMVRNSADHGLETPQERSATGKPEAGKITLNAYHEGGQIVIEIMDDGAGLSLEKIKNKVIENGLASAEELASMSPSKIRQFIFQPGFSTASEITAVSGRGVGMDVVRTNIEQIGGSIELQSEEGQGSTFTIKIPLTLAIISALLVETAGQRFAIPQLAVRELVMASETGENRIETINDTPVFRLRGRLLPLIDLAKLLQIETAEPIETRYIVITKVGAQDFGIIVDSVHDTEEIVVKPVAKTLRQIDLFSGNTILGDGSPVMILDTNGIARHIGEIQTAESEKQEEDIDVNYTTSKDKTALLLFRAGNETPKAVPLSLIARLENINLSDTENAGGRLSIQYRGKLMPLVPFDEASLRDGSEKKPVLVFDHQGGTTGMIVDGIIDITEELLDSQLDGGHEGLLGSTIIRGQTTDMVDVSYYLRIADKNCFMDHDDTPFVSEKKKASPSKPIENTGKKRILLVDDSSFFRNMLTPLLSIAGYEVVTLENALDALKMCDAGASFDLIVSDIEMPEMDGFEFAQKVKSETEWKEVPMVALTSHATPEDVDRGMEVGFTKYIAKFDRDTLLNTVSQTLAQQDNAKPSGDAA